MDKQEDIPVSEALSKLLHNPIKVHLHAEDERPLNRLTGRIIFYPPADVDSGVPFTDDVDAFNKACEDAASQNDGEAFSFDCGPEDDDHLADSAYCDQGLGELFSDFGNKIKIGESENHHVVISIPGIKAFDLWSVIRDRLLRSGAIPGK
jgi:hypothetical protein